MLQKIDRYEIKQEIGRGGMAAVYRAYDPRFSRDVAIKVLPPEFFQDAQFRARFEREARVVASLEHPAIVPVYDYGEYDGRLFLVMRLMSGGSLAAKLKGGPLPLKEAVRILGRLAPALDAAHAQGLVHRDLKPANILFDRWGEPYISDFGIVKVVDDTETALTMAGGIVGTPAYMSPEQVQSKAAIDGRSDIYALGCILFEMLTGRLPYQANTPIGIALMHVNEPVPRLETLSHGLPLDCERILAKAMAKDRENRYPTAGSLSADLRATLSGTAPIRAEPKPVSQETVIESSPRGTQGRAMQPSPPEVKPIQPEAAAEPDKRSGLPRWALIGAAVLALLLCVGGGVVVLSIINGGEQGNGELETPLAGVTDTIDSEVVDDAPTATATVTIAAVVVDDTPTSTPTQTATPTPARPPSQAVLGETWNRPADGMTMLYVPAGSFLMGSDPELDPQTESNEQLHEVTLDGFWIDQTEVTNDMFAAFVADTGYVTTAEIEGDGRVQIERQGEVVAGTDWQHPAGPESDIEGQGNFPVLQVSWFDSQEYCAWAGGSLPTEAQWAYAARGPESRIYPWGNTFDGNLVNFCDVNCPFPYANADFNDGSERLGPVGSLPGGASWVGAFDMVGNVWEWVADWYSAEYYLNSPAENPTGPETGDAKVLRGGSWYDDSPHVRAAQRGANGPEARHALYGFRCVIDIDS